MKSPDTNLVGFGTSAGLVDEGVAWVNTYLYGVVDRIRKVDSRIPMMIQDSFKGAEFCAPFYNTTDNVVLDTHVYYFAAAGTYTNYVNTAVCGQAQYIANQTKVSSFIDDWALQTMCNNTFAGREDIFDTQRCAWSEYVNGRGKFVEYRLLLDDRTNRFPAFWTAVSYSTLLVGGERTQRDYWSFVDLVKQGVVKSPVDGESYCS